MSLATDARYRQATIAWANNAALGSEQVVLFAKPLSGGWVNVATFAASQAAGAAWAEALPVTSYALALRFQNVAGPTVGYEGNDPDAWTAPTAAQSKGTLVTTSADVTLNSAPFSAAAGTVTLAWTSAQLGAPYLVEKNAGAGWVTVVADLVALGYVYTVPGGELGTTVQFRVTAKRGAIAGPVSGALAVDCFIGVPTWVSAIWYPATALAALSWSAAANAESYRIEKDVGAGWVTVATVGGLTHNYLAYSVNINATVHFRVTGLAGAAAGAPSSTQDLAFPLEMQVVTVVATNYNPAYPSSVNCTITQSGGNFPYRGCVIWIDGANVGGLGAAQTEFTRGDLEYRGKTIAFTAAANVTLQLQDGAHYYEGAISAPMNLVVPP